MQETLLAIHLKRHTWDPGQPLAPWVYAIARHKVVDALRRRGRRKVEPMENFEEFLAAPEAEDPHALSDARKLLETLAPAPARHRDLDLARRAVDRGDGEAPVDERGRGEGGAPPGAEVARRGMAEVGRVKTSRTHRGACRRPGSGAHPARQEGRALALALGALISLAIVHGCVLGPRPDIDEADADDALRPEVCRHAGAAACRRCCCAAAVAPGRQARSDAALWLLAPVRVCWPVAVAVELVARAASDLDDAGSWAATRCHCLTMMPLLCSLPHAGGADRGAARRRAALSRADRRARGARPRRASRRRSTRRTAPMIRRCSWRPGIRWRR